MPTNPESTYGKTEDRGKKVNKHHQNKKLEKPSTKNTRRKTNRDAPDVAEIVAVYI